jgi:hypothetical protein
MTAKNDATSGSAPDIGGVRTSLKCPPAIQLLGATLSALPDMLKASSANGLLF